MQPQKQKEILRKLIYLGKKGKNTSDTLEEVIEKKAAEKPKVYDSIKYRIDSGRDNHTIEELMEKFKSILESLKEKNMLTQEGRKVLNQPMMERDFELTSELVNNQGEKFLDRIYRRHQG